MRAVMAPAGLGHLEQPAYLDQISRSLSIHWVGPTAAVSGLVEDAVRRLQAIAGLVLVATFHWWLAILLLLAMVHNRIRFGPISRQIMNMRMGKAQGFRRADYLLNLALLPEAAKEVRVFGLADWLVGRYQAAWLDAMAGLWQERSDLWRTVLLAGLPVALRELGPRAGHVGHPERHPEPGRIGGAGRGQFGPAPCSGPSATPTTGSSTAPPGRPVMELERSLAADPLLNLPGCRPADDLPRQEISFEGSPLAIRTAAWSSMGWI